MRTLIALFIILAASAGSSYAQGKATIHRDMSRPHVPIKWSATVQRTVFLRCARDPYHKECYEVLAVLSRIVADIRQRQQWVQGKCTAPAATPRCKAVLEHKRAVVKGIWQEYKEVGTKWPR